MVGSMVVVYQLPMKYSTNKQKNYQLPQYTKDMGGFFCRPKKRPKKNITPSISSI